MFEIWRSDIILYGALCTVYICEYFVITWFRRKRYPINGRTIRTGLLGGLLFGVIIFVLLYGLVATVEWVPRIFAVIVRVFGLKQAQCLIAAIVMIAGILAYYFKGATQRWYGAVEVVVGFLSALLVAGTLTPGHLELAKMSTLAGAAYLIARGLGNYREGREKLREPALS
jgi:uncharacterized membrane protein YkvI